MGTNFYTRINECASCERFEEIHLGKSSAGWQFSFQYNDGKYYKNMPQMKKWLKDKIIKNEYGEVISNEDFWKMVRTKQSLREHNINHAAKYPSENDFVIDGYSFTNCYFS